MKTNFFTSITLFLFTYAAFCQNTISVDALPQTISPTSQVFFMVEIPQTNIMAAENNWLKYVATGSSGSADSTNREFHQEVAYDDNLSPFSFTVYSKMTEISDGILLKVWFSQNGSPFVHNDPKSVLYLAAQKYVRDFAVEQYRHAVEGELKAGQDKLKEMEKELVILNNEEEKSLNTLSENQSDTIYQAEAVAEDAIATTDSDIWKSSQHINGRKEMVGTTSADANAVDSEQKTLKKSEWNKNKLQHQNSTTGKVNDKRNKVSLKENRITSIAKKQHKALKSDEIASQRLKVDAVKVNLANIR